MKKTVFLLFTILILSNCRTLGSWNKMNPYPQKELTISKNITFQANRILYDEMVYDVCIINPQKITLKITKSLNESGLSFSKLNKDLKNKDEILIFATNGGMYEKDRTQLGYYAEENKIYHDLNRTDGYGNFYMKPNGVFFLQDQNPQILETEDFFQNIIEKGLIP
ncbi:MAG: hypothetical protein PF518_19975, partial [Spirochaetaceae bacterium]|nr:hypothetical protein [Spirochaetaceae bacterium]